MACGAKIIADEVAAANVGLTIELFGQSQLGSDADRIQSVVAGDIDMDIQGASALSAIYAPIGAVDGAFVFDDSEHMYRFFTDPASDALKQGFLDETGVRILGAWNTGARQFTANKPIRTPDDLAGLKMRFPPSPQFLMNAAAMGASPVEVAYDELYLALQQKIADGQENPLTNIQAINLPEVQSHRQPVEPPAQLEPGRDRQGLGHAQPGAAGSAHGRGREGHGRGAQVRRRCREGDPRRVPAPAAPWRSSRTSTARRSAPRRSPTSGSNFTPEQVVILDAIRSTAQ